MKVLLANPRGFCAGVDRAIEIVERALERYGPPIYVRHEVVHNRYVVEDLAAKGAIFVDQVEEVPAGAHAIFSAHGVSREVRRKAEERGLQIFDATCPLVTKVHNEVSRYQREERECVLIGHAGHPEVEGTLGQYQASGGGSMYLVENAADVAALEVHDPASIALVTLTQRAMDYTAVVMDALRTRCPSIVGPRRNDICYATQNRQDAVRDLAGRCQVLLVVGSRNSSNSNRLRELASKLGTRAHLVDGAADLRREWFSGIDTVGVTAGASAPEVLVRAVVDRLREWGGEEVTEVEGKSEQVAFSLPRGLQ